MPEKIELIPAAELPVAESDEVDVLCVENGELKRKEGASLGGGEQADLVIRINNHIENTTEDNISIASGSIEAVYTAFESGLIPVVQIEIVVPSTTDSYIRTGKRIPAQITFYGDALFVGFITTDIGGVINWTCRISCYENAITEFYKAQFTTVD